jgi:NitT/TauT family transport system substrate-binding protein
MQIIQSRRRFLAGAAAIGAAGLVGAATEAWAETPPETTSVRLPSLVGGGYCWAGLFLAGELLRADGFADVSYVHGDMSVDPAVWIARGETDFSVNYAPVHIASIDAGVPIKVLSGLHAGCLDLIANDSVERFADLKGKRVGMHDADAPSHVLVALMASYIGLDPANDIDWVVQEGNPADAFAQGKFDAYLFGPSQSVQLHAGKVGHTILNTTLDPPWSQHYCCMISAASDFVNNYPVATKRVLRAILKGADLCASDPSWSARQLVERGFVSSYDVALKTLRDNTRYDVWRDYDPEASMRFYALRMQETGMIKSSPQQIIANGTDFRIFEELKRELKI